MKKMIMIGGGITVIALVLAGIALSSSSSSGSGEEGDDYDDDAAGRYARAAVVRKRTTSSRMRAQRSAAETVEIERLPMKRAAAPSMVTRIGTALRAVRAAMDGGAGAGAGGFQISENPTTDFGRAMLALKRGEIAAVTVKKQGCPGCVTMTSMTNGLNVKPLAEAVAARAGVVEVDAARLNVDDEGKSQDSLGEPQFIQTVPAIYVLAHDAQGQPTGPVRYEGRMDADSMTAFVDAARATTDAARTVFVRLVNVNRVAPETQGNGGAAGNGAAGAAGNGAAGAGAGAGAGNGAAGAAGAIKQSSLLEFDDDAVGALDAFNKERAKGKNVILAIAAMDCGWSRHFLEMMQKHAADKGDVSLIAYKISTRNLPENAQAIADLYRANEPNGEGIGAYPSWIVAAGNAQIVSGAGAGDIDQIVRAATHPQQQQQH